MTNRTEIDNSNYDISIWGLFYFQELDNWNKPRILISPHSSFNSAKNKLDSLVRQQYHSDIYGFECYQICELWLDFVDYNENSCTLWDANGNALS